MNLPNSFLLNAGGLFDFDLTFLAEASLFVLFSLVVTFGFLNPISRQLTERAELINYYLRKSSILVTYGYNRLSTCVELLTEEFNELNRQLKLTRTYTNTVFEEEFLAVQNENVKLVGKLKGDLAIKSAILLSTVNKELISLTDSFFTKKFQSFSK